MGMFLGFSTVYAQQKIKISGNVTDTSGGPLPGVTVVIKGSQIGSITDPNGNYTVDNVPTDATLVFSFVGMKSQVVKVAGKRQINVVLEEESIGLEEVVAIGYGTTKRKDLTGSVASVDVESLKDIPANICS